MAASKGLASLRITVIHSAYRKDSISGENLAVELQTQALINTGASVDLFVRQTDQELHNHLYGTKSAFRVATGFDFGGDSLPPCEGPEHILLVHNLFPNFGNRLVEKWEGPVVAMMHNFRSVCANGLLLRDGHVCTKCITGNSSAAVQHGCYRNSRLATLPLAVATFHGSKRNPLVRRAERIICQSERSLTVFSDAGIDRSKLALVPGFTTQPPKLALNRTPERRWAFVGRLTPEKGLNVLLREWPESQLLDVVGDGPELDEARRIRPASVNLLGRMPRDWVLDELPHYQGLIYPGVCFEGAIPMVAREALSLGVPVVAASGSSAADLVSAHGGGVTYESGALSLEGALSLVEENWHEFSRQANSVYLAHMTVETWLNRMAAVFSAAMQARAEN